MKEAGIVVSGIGAVILGVMGVGALALTGLVWADGQLRQTTSYDASEASIGTGALWVTWIIAGALLVLALVTGLRQSKREPARRELFVTLAVAVPVIAVVLVGAAWFLLLQPGSASI